jgi:organic radical activating enzyme
LDKKLEILLNEGRLLPVMEEFYTLQGEGFHTGQASWFIRIGGCDVGCHWCDIKESWDATKYPPVPVDLIIENAASCPAKAIVVTGGEPLLYNLDYLCDRLKSKGITTFLETSGSVPVSGIWDWICLSPKKDAPPLENIYFLANELKVIVETTTDFEWAEENATKIKEDCKLYLQPEWSVSEYMTPLIIQYIKDHPKWKISLQSHKFMGIP